MLYLCITGIPLDLLEVVRDRLKREKARKRSREWHCGSCREEEKEMQWDRTTRSLGYLRVTTFVRRCDYSTRGDTQRWK